MFTCFFFLHAFEYLIILFLFVFVCPIDVWIVLQRRPSQDRLQVDPDSIKLLHKYTKQFKKHTHINTNKERIATTVTIKQPDASFNAEKYQYKSLRKSFVSNICMQSIAKKPYAAL